MVQVGTTLRISRETEGKLDSESCMLFRAAHEDGSDNRINGDAIVEATTCHWAMGLLTGAAQVIRKAFRNRGKTKDDLAAEKNAARINRSAGALREMLIEYIGLARQGMIDEELLDDLAGTLEEAHNDRRAGSLIITEDSMLKEIADSIGDFTAAIGESMHMGPAQKPQGSGEDVFSRSRDQLVVQKRLLGAADRG